MKFLNTRPKKILFWIFAVIITFIVLVIAFISPISKWAIEKYDMTYSGREITLDLAYVNPFTGSVYLKNLKIYEAGSDSLFFSAAGLSANFEMLKLLSKTYEISEVTLDGPVIKVIQNKKEFNFNDLIERFSSKDTISKETNESKEPAHFNLLNATIKNGTFYYVEKSIPVNYFIKQVNIETNGLRWDTDTMGFRYSFVSGVGSGGELQGTFNINVASLDFNLVAAIRKFDLSVFEQYVKDIARYGKVRGTLDASLKANGNFKSSQNVVANGPLAISDFHFGKNAYDDYLSFKRLAVDIVELSPSKKKYVFDSIMVLKPYFKYERYDHLDNLQVMFGEKGEEVKTAQQQHGKINILFEIGNYIQAQAKNFFRSDYKVRRLAIYEADLRYNDYTLNEKFSAAVAPLTITADSIERGDKWVNLHLHTGIKPYGSFRLDLSVNPKDSSDFVLKYGLKRVSMAMFNPYFVTYTSFPIDRGIIGFHGQATVSNGKISSTNHLVIIDPRVNNRQKRNGASWLPMRVFMFLVRERGNVIDYEIPIKGDLRDPKFKLGDVFLDALRNIFIKPVTVPYRTEVRNTENEIEKSLSLKWIMRKADMNSPQQKFMRKVAGFLKENPEEVITVRPELYTDREKEYILFFEAKKKYFMTINRKKAAELTEADSVAIERLPVKDSTFVFYLNLKGGKKLHTIQEKCGLVVSGQVVDNKLKALNAQRKKVFLSFFQEAGVEQQVKLLAVWDTVPFNGFSLYKIDFKQDMPEEMTEAYNKLEELDNTRPRNKFKTVRAKNKHLLDVK